MPTARINLPFSHCVVRLKNETINDANDRAIATAAAYFQSVLKGQSNSGTVVFITNDMANKVRELTEVAMAFLERIA
jgi:hypothetical protein